MAFLRENGICDCKIMVKCGECESERHNTAMHPGPAPQLKTSLPTLYGSEEEVTAATTVNSQCAEVCGRGLSSRYCSKICLVRVYPQGQQEKAIKMYAILDDLSNRYLARSDFFKAFDLQSEPCSYVRRTCTGQIHMSGRRAEGFQIEPVSGEVSLALLTTAHREDNNLGPSIDDLAFLKIKDEEVYRDEANSWVAPLPFRVPRCLPNNHEQALNRLISLRRTLDRNPEMRDTLSLSWGRSSRTIMPSQPLH